MSKINLNRFLLVLIGLVLFGCNGITVETVPVKLERFEEDLFAIELAKLDPELKALEQKYPEFFPLYMNQILSVGPLDDSLGKGKARLAGFLENEAIIKLQKKCAHDFADITQLEAELGQAFGMMKHYFPDHQAPRVVTFISEFGNAALTYDSTLLGIGLDMYLGRDYKYYPSVGFPYYMIRRLQPEYIVPNGIQVMLSEMFDLSAKNNKLLDQIVYNGKIYYMAGRILPEVGDSLFTGYTSKQMDWCNENERQIWSFFISKDLLFSSNAQLYTKYVSEGPNSSGMPTESPGNIGSWVGWQIVRKYMKNYPEVTMRELMSTDAHKILNQAGYKP